MKELREWKFRNGVEVDERYIDDADTYGFKVYFKASKSEPYGEYLGDIVPTKEQFKKYVKKLDEGFDPIGGKWDDGHGHTCNLKGWDWQMEPDNYEEEQAAFQAQLDREAAEAFEEWKYEERHPELREYNKKLDEEYSDYEDELLRQEERENWTMK